MDRFRLPLATALAATLWACAPPLDWREFQAEGSGIVATFPCKPDRHSRSVALAAQTVRMEMLVCSAGDVTFALSFADLADPGQVSLHDAAAPAVHGVPRFAFAYFLSALLRAVTATLAPLH
jgi:hypothetical protein